MYSIVMGIEFRGRISSEYHDWYLVIDDNKKIMGYYLYLHHAENLANGLDKRDRERMDVAMDNLLKSK